MGCSYTTDKSGWHRKSPCKRAFCFAIDRISVFAIIESNADKFCISQAYVGCYKRNLLQKGFLLFYNKNRGSGPVVYIVTCWR